MQITVREERVHFWHKPHSFTGSSLLLTQISRESSRRLSKDVDVTID